jgi:hypothetical protein
LTSTVSSKVAFSSTSVEVSGDQIRERARRLNRIDERPGLSGQLGHELDHLLGDVAQAHAEGFGLVVGRVLLLESA